MADDRSADINLNIEIDRNQTRKSLAELENAKKGVKSLTDAQNAATKASQAFARNQLGLDNAIRRVGKDAQKTNTILKGSTKQIKGLTTSLSDAERKAEAFNRQLKETQKQSRETRSTLGQLEDVSASFGGALGTVGRQRAEQVLPGAGDVVAAAEALPEFFGAMNAIPEAALAAKAALAGMSVSIGGLTLTMGPLLILFAGFTVAAKLISDQIKEGKDRLESATGAREAEIRAIKNLTQTEIQERIDSLETEQEVQKQIAADFRNAQDSIGKFLGMFTGVNKALKEAEQASMQSEDEILALNRALEDSAVVARSAAEAQNELLQAQLASIKEQASFDQQVEDLAEEGTQAQLDAQLKALATQKGVAQKELAALELLAAQGEDVSEEIEALAAEILLLSEKEKKLKEETSDLIAAREKEEKAMKEAEKAEEDRAKSIEKATDDIARLQERAAQRTIDIETRLADRLLDIAVRAAQAEEDVLLRQSQKLDDLHRDRANDEIDALRDYNIDAQEAIVEAQRDEAKAAQDQVAKLKKIRDDAAADEFESALMGDFAAIARSRRDTRRQLQETSRGFNEAAKDRQLELKQELEDNAEAFLLEREQRLIENERRLEALKIQADREEAQRRKNLERRIEAVNTAAQRELERLQDKLNKELTLKQQAFDIELGLLNEFAQKAAEILNNAKKKSKPAGSGGVGSTEPKFLAGGGTISPGQSAFVNEAGTESISSGGNTMMLPGGVGLFTPFQQSTVNPAQNGPVSINMPITISGVSDPGMAVKIAQTEIAKTLDEVFS